MRVDGVAAASVFFAVVFGELRPGLGFGAMQGLGERATIASSRLGRTITKFRANRWKAALGRKAAGGLADRLQERYLVRVPRPSPRLSAQLERAPARARRDGLKPGQPARRPTAR